MGRLFLFITFIFFTGLTFFSRNIPFFWDSALYCDISHYYYNTGFSSLLLPPDLDPSGSPMIYWIYMAAAWSIFGKSLLVSHLVFLPFLLGIAWEYYKLARKFLSPALVPAAMLLLMAEPTLSMQSVILSYDVPKAWLFLLALNAVLGKKNILFSIALCLLALSSTRGMFLALSLMGVALYFWKQSGEKKLTSKILSFAPGILALAGWMAYHYHRTRWILFTPDDAYHHQRSILPLSMVFRQCLYVFWQLCDFGRVFIWGFIAAGLIWMRYKKMPFPSAILLSSLFFTMAVLMITMCPFSIPIGHKYFLVLFLIAPIAALHIFQQFGPSKKIVRIIISLFIIALVSGNFWIYGGGLSNGWDSSLKTLPYFRLKEEADAYVKEKNIIPAAVGTRFPLHHDNRSTGLSEECFRYSDLGLASMDSFSYILLSNVSNQFTLKEKEELEKKWKLEKEFKRGQVWLKLYSNPMPHDP